MIIYNQNDNNALTYNESIQHIRYLEQKDFGCLFTDCLRSRCRMFTRSIITVRYVYRVVLQSLRIEPANPHPLYTSGCGCLV